MDFLVDWVAKFLSRERVTLLREDFEFESII